MVVCPHTGIAVPECSCNPCLEDQIRGNMPILLEQEESASRIRGRAAWWRRRRAAA